MRAAKKMLRATRPRSRGGGKWWGVSYLLSQGVSGFAEEIWDDASGGVLGGGLQEVVKVLEEIF